MTSDPHSGICPTIRNTNKVHAAQRRKAQSRTKLDQAIFSPFPLIQTAPNTKSGMNTAAPSSELIPRSTLPEVIAAKPENRSGAVFAKARKVTPATFCDNPKLSAI
eukprot:54892_1